MKKKPLRAPVSLLMWAAIVPTSRSSYIAPWTIAATRREAAEKYRSMWEPEHRAGVIKRHGVTFRRVVVAVQEQA